MSRGDGRPYRVDVPDRHGGGHEEGRAGREGAQRCGRVGAFVVGVGVVVCDGGPGGRFDLHPGARPGGAGGWVAVVAVRQPAEHFTGRRMQVVLRQTLVVLAVSAIVDDDLGGLMPRLQGRLQRSRGGGAADPHDQVGAQAAKQLGVAQIMIVRPQDRHRGGIAEPPFETGAGERIGERGHPHSGGEANHGRPVQTGIRDRTRDQERPPRGFQAVGEQGILVAPPRTTPARPGARRTLVTPFDRLGGRGQIRRHAGAAAAQLQSLRGFRLQRLVERHIEVHGSARRAHRVPGGAPHGLDHGTGPRCPQSLHRWQRQVGLEA